MGTQLPSPQKGYTSPQFSAHVHCGQTAGWIKMTLGSEVCLGPGDIVLEGTQLSPTERGTTAPHFWAHVCCGQTVAHLSNVEHLVQASYRYYIGKLNQ